MRHATDIPRDGAVMRTRTIVTQVTADPSCINTLTRRIVGDEYTYQPTLNTVTIASVHHLRALHGQGMCDTLVVAVP